jgi:hypothetical protein
MKVQLKITVDVDPVKWSDEYGCERTRVREDVRSYFVHHIHQSPAVEGTGLAVCRMPSTAYARIAQAATAAGWTPLESTAGSYTPVWDRGTESIAVTLDRAERVYKAEHYTGGRWVEIQGRDKAARVIHLLSSEES